MSQLERVKNPGEAWSTISEEAPASFNGGTILLEVLNELTLDNTGLPAWTFDAPYIQTSQDVTINQDGQTLNFNTDGWYVIWYSFAVKASASTVKAQVQSFIDGAPVGNLIRDGSLGETQPHLDGAVSLGDLTTPFTSPPVPFSAGDSITFRASATYTGGSVGDATLSTNSYVAVVRVA